MRRHVALAVAALVSASYLTAARGADIYWEITPPGPFGPGDYNNNTVTDAPDYIKWRKTPGSFGGVGGHDTWRLDFGNYGGAATPNGAWDSATANWSTNPAGGVGTQIWNASGNDVAVFSAGSAAIGPYTVTVNAPTASGLRLEDGDVSLSSGSLTLKTGSSVDVASGHTMTVVDTTLTNSSAETIAKTGTGTLALNSTNTLAGIFNLNTGTVGIGNVSAFGGTSNTAGTQTLNINGGSISNTNPNTLSPIVNVVNSLTTNINGNFSVENSPQGNHLISFQSSVAGGGSQNLTGTRTITVNQAPNAGSLGSELAGLAFRNLKASNNSYGVIKQGTGTLRFEAPNDAALASAFQGDVTVQQGSIEVDGSTWIGGKVSTNPTVGQTLGGNTINLAGGNFNVTFTRNASNPINNPFVVTADSKFTSTINSAGLSGTLSETFFGGLSSPNNSKITFENLNPSIPTTANASCPAGGICQIYYARWAGATGFTYGGNVEIKNHATTANQMTRLSNFNTTGTTITWNGVISGNGQFSRSATSGGTAGDTVLNGANTYSGLTLVSDGTLYLNNTNTGSGGVWVNFGDSATFYNAGSRGTLAGNGSTTSAISVGRRGVLKPGTIASPIAAFSGGALTFSDANTLFPAVDPANYAFDLNSSLSPSVGADLMNVNGNLTFGGTFAALSVTDLAASSATLSNGTKYTLISYSGTWDGNTFNGLPDNTGTVTVSSGGGFTNTFTINYDDTTPGSNLGGGLYTKYVTLTRTSAGSGSLVGGTVPEPTSAMLALVGLVPLLCRRRR